MKKVNAINKSILVISDCHIPYHLGSDPKNKDAVADSMAFLYEIKKRLKPDIVMSVGDIFDNHAISFHQESADLFSPGDELEKCIELIHQKKYGLATMFEKLIILSSNHDDLYARKIKVNKLPIKVLKELKDIYGTPGWNWYEKVILKIKNFEDVYCVHGQSSNGLKLANHLGCSSLQGHFHTACSVAYSTNSVSNKRRWSMQVGALIGNGLAFEYNKLQLARPELGVGWISEEGVPSIIPLILNKKGRWIGKIIQ